MSKQTSVDFLLEEFSAILGKVNFTTMQGLLLKDAIEKAKEMEKEQIIEAHGAKQYHKTVNGEQYYNETYKNK